MKKYIALLLLGTMLTSVLTGCGLTGKVNLSNIPSMTLDEVAGSRLVASTNQEVESEIYNYVTDRIVVDGTKLIKVSDKDEKNITALLANINTQLSGKGGDILTPEYANYLLLEFAKTPFEWVQSNKDVVGFDPAARLYFVDVTYTTTSTYKSVVPDSKIVNGDPDGDKLKQKRYTDYLTMLSAKQQSIEKYNGLYNTFITRWGNIQDIFNEQQGVSLYNRTVVKGSDSGGIGKLTYSGLVSDNTLSNGAKMTIRYVLKYSLNLGEETDLSVEALYLKNYSLTGYEDTLKKYTLSDAVSLEVLKPFIDQLILSYNKSVEESNHIGLYKLFSDYSVLDKYYDEIRDYTYNSIGAYSYQILERKNNGKEVAVKVNRINQIRARGAEMSLPTYEEVLVFNLVLGKNDTISIKDIYLLNSNLIGEPLSVIKNVTGISDQIQYSDMAFAATNKQKVEDLLKKFSKIVTNNDYSSADFLACVDLGISQNTLNRMVDTIKAITPNNKSTYIVSWNTKTNVYCSVTVREVFECENGNFDTESVIDMGNRNGIWKVVNYTRTVNIKTKNTDVNTDNAFCLDTRTSDGETTTIGEVKDKNVEITKPTDNPSVVKDPLLPVENGSTPDTSTPNISGEDTTIPDDSDTSSTPDMAIEVPKEDTIIDSSVGDFD